METHASTVAESPGLLPDSVPTSYVLVGAACFAAGFLLAYLMAQALAPRIVSTR